MQLGIFDGILILMAMSLFMTILAQKLKIPNTIGFIVSGIVLGPHMISAFPVDNYIQHIAEFGLVFLMFALGLEFSWPKLIRLRREVFGFGGLQVVLSILVTTLIGVFLLSMSLTESIVVGAIVGMSSTAVVLKQLRDQSELRHQYGQATLSILLFQDLAVIPLLILIPSLESANFNTFSAIMLIALFKAFIAIMLIVILGRYVLRPLYSQLTQAHSAEVFTILTVFIMLGAAWLTSKLGLSLTLGAFLAGLMLSETEHSKKIETEIKPIQNVLMGLFFIAIGMQFNISVILGAWPWMLLLMLALIGFKTVLIYVLGLFFLSSKVDALKTGLALANGGEFGFAILIVATKHDLIPMDYGQVILGAILLSMILAPLIIKYHNRVTKIFI
jgi:monovalent cation:H+ antiporter-2, CPA2 family